jgi:dolichol-phosphate mannosyltransferase
VLVIALAFLTRLVFSGLINLIPEEAYYWNYARNLDFGYLDHPPMVAWLGWLSTALLGKTEFAVRLPALLSWLVLAVFMFRFAQEAVGKAAAYGCLVLLSVLPIYWSVGFLMTPDAPLYAAWAAGLFYARRALVDADRRAWIGFGLSLGLGLLSKYTIALLGASVLAVLLFDKAARKHLATPGPYVAFGIAALLFSPVVWWNAGHNWASFAFQGGRRWSGEVNFHLHLLAGSAVILLTPVGFIEAMRSIGHALKQRWQRLPSSPHARRNLLFGLAACLVPLSVFVVHSLMNQTKLNWTGPVWLSILPLVASRIASPSKTRRLGIVNLTTRNAWRLSIVFLVVFYPLVLGWIYTGAPGLPRSAWSNLPVAWAEMGDAVEQIEIATEKETGEEPLIVGTDKYWIASESSFYDSSDVEALPEFAGLGIIGRNDLMWSYWTPSSMATGRNIILIGMTPSGLDDPAITRQFTRLDPIQEQEIVRHGRTVGQFYWRRGYNFRPLPPPAPTASPPTSATTTAAS